jgi:hypothetical protein
LEALGVRDAGDTSHFEEDAFEIPEEYASDISAAVAREKRARALSLKVEPSSKGVKLFMVSDRQH